MCYNVLQNMGSKVTIRRLIWDTRNKRHIARHHVDPDEVEDVVFGNPLPERGKTLKRLVLVGETEGKRLLEVVLQNHGAGEWYPLTAYEASDEKRAVYTRERGGEEKQ
jgi:uncharacterized DUF497 family protein